MEQIGRNTLIRRMASAIYAEVVRNTLDGTWEIAADDIPADSATPPNWWEDKSLIKDVISELLNNYNGVCDIYTSKTEDGIIIFDVGLYTDYYFGGHSDWDNKPKEGEEAIAYEPQW